MLCAPNQTKRSCSGPPVRASKGVSCVKRDFERFHSPKIPDDDKTALDFLRMVQADTSFKQGSQREMVMRILIEGLESHNPVTGYRDLQKRFEERTGKRTNEDNLAGILSHFNHKAYISYAERDIEIPGHLRSARFVPLTKPSRIQRAMISAGFSRSSSPRSREKMLVGHFRALEEYLIRLPRANTLCIDIAAAYREGCETGNPVTGLYDLMDRLGLQSHHAHKRGLVKSALAQMHFHATTAYGGKPPVYVGTHGRAAINFDASNDIEVKASPPPLPEQPSKRSRSRRAEMLREELRDLLEADQGLAEFISLMPPIRVHDTRSLNKVPVGTPKEALRMAWRRGYGRILTDLCVLAGQIQELEGSKAIPSKKLPRIFYRLDFELRTMGLLREYWKGRMSEAAVREKILACAHLMELTDRKANLAWKGSWRTQTVWVDQVGEKIERRRKDRVECVLYMGILVRNIAYGIPESPQAKAERELLESTGGDLRAAASAGIKAGMDS